MTISYLPTSIFDQILMDLNPSNSFYPELIWIGISESKMISGNFQMICSKKWRDSFQSESFLAITKFEV